MTTEFVEEPLALPWSAKFTDVLQKEDRVGWTVLLHPFFWDTEEETLFSVEA